MGQPNFKVEFKGETLSLGLQIPDKIPLSFAEYPLQQVMPLDQIKKIYSNPNRKHALEIYTTRKQQGRSSSCCPYAATTSLEAKRKFDRKQDVEYQPEYLYANINGGRDAGAMLDDAMKFLLAKGCCLKLPKLYQDHTLNDLTMEEKRFAAQQALDYRPLDWYQAPIRNIETAWAAMVSAIAARDPVLMAVHCGDNFFSAGPDGKCKPDKGPGNHAVCGLELEGVLTARSLRDISIWAVNSHGSRAGKNGCYLHTYDHAAEPVNYHQHCMCRSMRSSPDEQISTLLG